MRQPSDGLEHPFGVLRSVQGLELALGYGSLDGGQAMGGNAGGETVAETVVDQHVSDHEQGGPVQGPRDKEVQFHLAGSPPAGPRTSAKRGGGVMRGTDVLAKGSGKMLRRVAIAQAATWMLAGCSDSNGPSDIAGRYSFIWNEQVQMFVPPEVAQISGTLTVTPGTGNPTVVLQSTYVDPAPRTAVWLGSDYQMLFVGEVPASSSTSFYSFSLAVHWTPGATCTGQLNVPGISGIVGTCTVTLQP